MAVRSRTKSDFVITQRHVDVPKRCISEIDTNSVVQSRGHRHEDVAVRDEFLDEIRRLHAEFKAQACLKRVGEGLTDMVLEEAFGKDGSWMMLGKLPEDGVLFSAAEEAYSLRQFTSSPSGLKSSTLQGLLELWGAAVLNSKGCKSEQDNGSLGQDNCCLARLAGGWELVGVFDGHGPWGHWPATRAAKTLPYFLQDGAGAELLREGDIEEALRFAFEAVEAELEGESAIQNVDLQISGCTAVVALHHPQRDSVWLATLGDSRAALLAPGQGVMQETSDHKPSRQDEADRITRLGGDVKETRYGDGFIDQRVYVKGAHYPGLGVTRSFGDCAVKDVGVCAEPEIVRWSLQGKDNQYVLLCSDGVWEFLAPSVIADCILKALEEKKTPQQAVEELLARSRQAWKEKEEATYCDDITMVLLPLAAGTQAPPWEAAAEPEEKSAVSKALAESNGDGSCLVQ